jgi:hypothetical protein
VKERIMSKLSGRFGLVLLVLGLAGAASAAQREPSLFPVPRETTGIITLGPASFQVRVCEWEQAYLDYEIGAFESMASFRVEEGFPSVSLAAPVHLPDGAVVVSVTVNYFDNDQDTEPSMGLYAMGEDGRPSLIVDASGIPGFAKGATTVLYKAQPMPLVKGAPYEFLVTLNRSLIDYTVEHKLFRVQIAYRIPLVRG